MKKYGSTPVDDIHTAADYFLEKELDDLSDGEPVDPKSGNTPKSFQGTKRTPDLPSVA